MKKFLITLSILLIIVATFGIEVGASRASKNEKKLAAAADQRRATSLAEDGLNVYGSLSLKKDVNALVIGDSIGQGNGASNENSKWFNLVAKDVKQKYKSTMTTDLITGGSTTGIRGWVELNNANDIKKYDIAFMCFGQNDQWSITPKQFGIFYEGIIVNLKKTNPNIEIIPIIESSFREYNDYSSVIKDLSKHYNLQYADTIMAFVGSSDTYENLTKDAEIPNDKGYSYYAKSIEKVINVNFAAKKKTNVNYTILYKDTNKLNNFVFDNSPEINNGFNLNDSLISNKVSDTVTFNTTSSLAIIHYLRQASGGKFKVYLDDKFVKEIDTNSTFKVSYSNLISDTLTGKHKIKIVVSSVNKGGTVNILGLATN